jgi:uncharacterized protein YkwD
MCTLVATAGLTATADAKRHRRHHRRPHVVRSHQTALATCPGANDVPTAATAAAAQASTLCLVNNERIEQGLAPLADNARLDAAAAAHSADMAASHYFSHDSPAGSTVVSRITQSGYLTGAPGWSIGENIAWGTGALATPDAIVRAWMNSPGHRANILRPDFADVGTGVTAAAPPAGLSGPGATYTQDFGTRR